MSSIPLLRQARTRSVLAALGIPVWAARDEAIQSVAVASLWGKRGQDAIEVTSELVRNQHADAESQVEIGLSAQSVVPQHQISSVVHTRQLLEEAQSLSTHIPRAGILPQEHNSSLPKDQPIQDKPTRQPFAQTIASSEMVHVEQVLRFSLEARIIGEWVVLVSVQALNHPDRRTLWQNINQAFQSAETSNATEAYRLDWPLAEGARWQHNVGAQAALMGFLTRFGTERRVGVMGELPDSITPEHLERLPSLDELLHEPLKKRSLWRLLSGQIR